MSYAPLQHLADVILNLASRVPGDLSDDFKETYSNEIDFDKVTTELRFEKLDPYQSAYDTKFYILELQTSSCGDYPRVIYFLS